MFKWKSRNKYKKSSSLIYSHNRKLNTIVRKSTRETMAKRITVFHARKDNSIPLVNIVIAKSNDSYTNQTIIKNSQLYIRGIIY